MRTSFYPVHLGVVTLVAILASTLGGCGGGKDPAELPAEEVVQKGCSENADCTGGRCVDGLPGGLCTANCTSQGDCPEGTVCTDTEAHSGVCLFPCSNAGECRDKVGTGYTCDEESNLTSGEDVRVCIDA